MLTQEEALVGGIDHDGVIRETLVIEILQDAAHTFIHGFDAAEVVVHIALIAPAYEFLAGEVGLHEFLVARLVISIPFLFLLRCKLAYGD